MSNASNDGFAFSFGTYEPFDPESNHTESEKESLLTTHDRELEDYLNKLNSGADTWTFDGTDLHPTTDPTSLTVNADGGNIDLTTDRKVNITAPDSNASSVNISGNTYITSSQQVEINVIGAGKTLFIDTNSGAQIVVLANGPVSISSNDGTSDVTILNQGTGNIVLNPRTASGGGYTKILGLPTSDPGVSGALYTLAGVLKVSP